MTSTQAVGKVRWLFKAEKAGHGGTLDPLATGLLPIALGEATKTVPFAMDGKKQYRFTVKWGEERTTDDLEGEPTVQSVGRPSQLDIESILYKFQGDILQAPPAFSAIKVAGERAYDLARAGETVDLAARPVTIESLVLVAAPDPKPSPPPQAAGEHGLEHSTFEVTCGKGTYVRSLARDMGRALGCLGHVTMLRRIAVGPFTEAHMISLEKLEEFSHKARGGNAMARGPADEADQTSRLIEEGALMAIETVLDGIPALAVDGDQAQRLRMGQAVRLGGEIVPQAAEAVLVTCGGKPVGIGQLEQGTVKPKRLFNL